MDLRAPHAGGAKRQRQPLNSSLLFLAWPMMRLSVLRPISR